MQKAVLEADDGDVTIGDAADTAEGLQIFDAIAKAASRAAAAYDASKNKKGAAGALVPPQTPKSDEHHDAPKATPRYWFEKVPRPVLIGGAVLAAGLVGYVGYRLLGGGRRR
jgi:hypothetical protein